MRRIICRALDPMADLPFDVPCFASEPLGSQTFEGLSNQQLADYREKFRRLLDREVEDFDPHLIHAQHIWVQGQLALETGVSYLLTAWGAELESYDADPRYRALADQAAENAGKILVHDEAIRQRVLDLFEDVADRTIVLPGVSPEALGRIYASTFEARFGRAP